MGFNTSMRYTIYNYKSEFCNGNCNLHGEGNSEENFDLVINGKYSQGLIVI